MSHRSHRPDAGRSIHANDPLGRQGGDGQPRKLEIVVKADTRGTLDAVVAAVGRVAMPGVDIGLIERGVGDVTKSDLDMAITGSRLVLGFNVGAMAKSEEFAREHDVEIRLYDVVDHLARDLEEIARSLVPAHAEEKILGQARVVALFKSTRKGAILGCEVLAGRIALGKPFRVITAAGPIYEGVVESLHIENDSVSVGKPGQKVGLKIHDFKRARVGDLLECFEKMPARTSPWSPRPGVQRLRA